MRLTRVFFRAELGLHYSIVMAGRRLAYCVHFFLSVITVYVYVFLDAVTPLTHKRNRPHRVGAPEVQKPKVFQARNRDRKRIRTADGT